MPLPFCQGTKGVSLVLAKLLPLLQHVPNITILASHKPAFLHSRYWNSLSKPGICCFCCCHYVSSVAGTHHSYIRFDSLDQTAVEYIRQTLMEYVAREYGVSSTSEPEVPCTSLSPMYILSILYFRIQVTHQNASFPPVLL